MQNRRILTWTVQATILAALALVAAAPGAAAPDAGRGRHAADAPSTLAEVRAREYKFLISPQRIQPTPEATLREVWHRVQASAARHGFTVTEKPVDPMKIETSTKAYLDTRDQALWSRGYIIRVTTQEADGKPDALASVTVKAIHPDPSRTLATPLAVVGAGKVRLGAEENIGFGPDGQLGDYLEKGASFSVPAGSLAGSTLGDVGRYLPELLRLGLPADTVLMRKPVRSYQVKPGTLVLGGGKPIAITMEGWSTSEGGPPVAYDVSFGYSSAQAFGTSEADRAARRFMVEVLHGADAGLWSADNDRWGGSKVRWLMDRPLPPR